MKRTIKLFIAVFTLLCITSSCTKEEYRDLTATISGTVVDFDTQQALSGVLITVSPEGWTTYTGVNGFFLLNNLNTTETKVYDIQTQKSGYQDDRNRFKLSPGETIVINFALKKEVTPQP